MIELRRKLERARSHPVLGPIVLIVLVLLLAMVFLHGMDDSHDAAIDLGAVCIALAVAFVFVPLERVRRMASPLIAVRRLGRAPPPGRSVALARRETCTGAPLSLPLRR